MRTNNPVLSRPDAFTPGYPTTQSVYDPNASSNGSYSNYSGFDEPRLAAQPTPQAGRMSIEDVIVKTAILLTVLVATAAAVWMLLPLNMMIPVAMIGSIAVVVVVMFVAMRRSVSPVLVGIYAVIEGLVIGSWSAVLEVMYPGIVTQAVLGTLVGAAVVLAMYRFLNVRVQGRLAQIVVAATIAYAVLALVNLGLMFAGMNLGLFTMGSSAGMLSWLTAGIGVILAVASLLMDFESIENGVRIGAPESESWRAAFGLIVTLVWLYTLIIRILSYFRSN